MSFTMLPSAGRVGQDSVQPFWSSNYLTTFKKTVHKTVFNLFFLSYADSQRYTVKIKVKNMVTIVKL